MLSVLPLPPNSSISCEQDAGRVRIALPAVGLRAVQQGLFVTSFGLLWMLVIASVVAWAEFNRRGKPDPFGSAVFFAFFLPIIALLVGVCLFGFAATLEMGCRQTEIEFSPEQLSLAIRGWWRNTRLTWRREQLVAFDADLNGLWVFHSVRPKAFLSERPFAELRWLADTLAAGLDLPGREPLDRDEIDIYAELNGEDASKAFGGAFGKPPFEKAHPARLAVQQGRLTVRLAANRLHAFRFFLPRCAWWFSPEWLQALQALRVGFRCEIPLRDDEIAWQERDGAPCLEITAPYPFDVSLRIWSDDPESLIDLTERFWPPETGQAAHE